MSPGVTRVRATWRFVAVVGVGALVLASCGVATTSHEGVHGTPALSISVALSNVGCASNDVCVAVGTSSESVGPVAVGEYATPNGRWQSLTLPTSLSPNIDAAACSGTTCLLGGSEPGSDLLWVFNAKEETLNDAVAPPEGIGVDALSCNGTNCALVDTGAMGDLPRLSLSINGGQNWTLPLPMSWAKGDVVTTLSCGTVFNCAVGTLSSTHLFSLHVTLNGGTTWSASPTPSTWSSLTSLTCEARHCVGLANEGGSSALVRSITFTRTWSSVLLSERANALACTTLSTCVVVGQSSTATGWLASVHGDVVKTVRLRYVPTPLLGVGCGSEVCAAIGVTTLLSVPSTS
ncbi:MAG: hypothetical protein WAK12_05550 [Acidimicrobiales bacterium]